MNRFPRFAILIFAVLLFGLGSAALARFDDEKGKEKPKKMFDDATATLTETVDGKTKETKVDLKYSLKVKGFFNDKGFNIEEVEADGPATRLNGMSLEKGDIIVEVDGKPVKSAEDYAKAMNGAADHSKTKIKVRDVQTGNEVEFEAEAAKR